MAGSGHKLSVPDTRARYHIVRVMTTAGDAGRMRLHKRLIRRRESGKVYYGWDIALPAEAVAALGWAADTELEWRVRGGVLTVRPKRAEP